MTNDFKNLQEYRKIPQKTEEQEEIYRNDIKKTSSKASAESQEISEYEKLLNDMPGIQKLREILENYQQEFRESENLTEFEFEEKYKSQIERSVKCGRNGWVISNYSDIKIWEQLLCEGESKVEDFFEKNDIEILDMLIEDLQEKYVSKEIQLYFDKGMQAFENKEYMTAAMYLLAVLDNRVNKLVDFPKRYQRYKEKYSDKGFENQKKKDFKWLTQKKDFYQRKYTF